MATTIGGKFTWTDDLPDDEDVEMAPEPRFSSDFGEQWQFMATQPVIASICNALRLQDAVTGLEEPTPDDHGWYCYFLIDGWQCDLFVYWTVDDEQEDCFEFIAKISNPWFHRIIHRSQFADHFRALGAALARAFAAAPNIARVVYD